jgi:hypothetical protein
MSCPGYVLGGRRAGKGFTYEFPSRRNDSIHSDIHFSFPPFLIKWKIGREIAEFHGLIQGMDLFHGPQ